MPWFHTRGPGTTFASKRGGDVLVRTETWRSLRASPPSASAERLIDRFIPRSDVAERHETLVRAPADLTFDVAQRFDLQSIPLVHTIFWLRAKLSGGAKPEATWPRGLVVETKALGWGELAFRPGRELVMGAVTQPWKADVEFKAVPPDRFAAFVEPDLVKIVWTLEAEPLGPTLTRLRTETRALATDARARRIFRRYWRLVGIGILMIRCLALPAIRRAAERRVAAGDR
jgi:hypothetical protein